MAHPTDSSPPSTEPAPAPRPRPAWRRLSEAPVSVGLVVLQVLALAAVTWRLGDPTSADVLVQAGALERGRVQGGEWWRLLSAAFLHVGWIHLAVNSVFGFGWCLVLERALGRGRLLALWLLGALGASAASLLWRDVVSAGASGPLFGLIGATLVLHRRVLPSWRAFLTSPATIQVVVQLALWTGVALVGSLHIDHAAHLGGLVTGAAAAWIMTRPPPRHPLAWLPLAAVLALAAAAAVWPRAGFSRYQGEGLVREVRAALEAKDLDRAQRDLDRLDAAAWRSDLLDSYRAYLLIERSRLDEAVAIARRLLVSDEGPELRRAGRKLLLSVGYRLYTGDGAKADPPRGYGFIREACDAGDEKACVAEKAIRTGVPASQSP